MTYTCPLHRQTLAASIRCRQSGRRHLNLCSSRLETPGKYMIGHMMTSRDIALEMKTFVPSNALRKRRTHRITPDMNAYVTKLRAAIQVRGATKACSKQPIKVELCPCWGSGATPAFHHLPRFDLVEGSLTSRAEASRMLINSFDICRMWPLSSHQLNLSFTHAPVLYKLHTTADAHAGPAFFMCKCNSRMTF